MHLHVSSTCAHRQEVKIALHSLWYHHTETSEWSKITKIQFYKYKHIRYIKNNDPRSAYALHVLNCRHEYGNIDDTMTLLKQINTPTLLLSYEQMYIQSFHHNNELNPRTKYERT